MKMTAMKRPTFGERPLILPVPKAAIKSTQIPFRRPENIRPAIFSAQQEITAPNTNTTTQMTRASDSRSQPAALRKTSSKRMARRLAGIQPRIKVRKPAPIPKRFASFSIPKTNFQRVVRDIAMDCIPDCKFTSEALYALQTSCEDFLIGFFSDAHICAMHAKRKTLMLQDMNLVKRLRNMDYLPI